MKNFLLLMVFAVSAQGAFISSVPTFSMGPLTKAVWTEQALTNAVNASQPGSQILIMPGRYYFPSPTLNLNRPHVSYYAFGGVTIVIGSTQAPFGYSGTAATNWWKGDADFILSNQVQLVNMTVAGALANIECNSIWRRGTNFSVGIFEQDHGQIICKWRDFCRTDPYDIYVNPFGNSLDSACSIYLEGPRWQWGDSCLEAGSWTLPGQATFVGAFGEQLPNVHAPPSGGPGVSFLGDNCVVRIPKMYASTNGTWAGLGSDNPPSAVFDVRELKAATAGRYGLFDQSGNPMSARWVNTTFIGPSGFDPLFLGAGSAPIFENCKVISGASATNSLRAAAAMSVRVVGKLSIDKPVHDFVSLNGAVDGISGPLTNIFGTQASPGGTNVFVSLNGHSEQVVIVSNTCLLIVTNGTALESGKRVSVTLYNNANTNEGVYMSLSGQRLIGTDSGLISLASTHNSLTNGRSMRIEFLKEGTNYLADVTHQR